MTKTEQSKVTNELSPLEQDVMNVVWELGECSSAEVIVSFKKTRKLADTTIRTVLANLRKKGYLKPVPTIERGFRLKPCVSREEVAHRSVGKLLSNFFGGSPKQAISFLLKDERIDHEEMEEIRRLLEDRLKNEGRR